MSYVIFALTGDYSKVAEKIEKEWSKEKGVSSEMVDKLPVGDLRALVRRLSKENIDNKQTISLLKEELNELYLKYDAICAAFGEMNHFIQEAAKVPTRHSIEK